MRPVPLTRYVDAAGQDVVTCGQCTERRYQSDCQKQPVGRNNAMVWVCRWCADDDAPRRVTSTDFRMGYVAADESTGGGTLRTRLRKMEVEKFGDTPAKRKARKQISIVANELSYVPRDAKAKLHRIWRNKGSRFLTFEEALKTAEKQDWYLRSVFIGGDVRAFVWQETTS